MATRFLQRYNADEPQRVVPALWPMPEKHRDVKQIASDLRLIIRSHLDGLKPWPLFLHGEPGSGKTCAGMCIVDNAGGSIYVTLPDLCGAIASAQFGRVAFYEYGASRVRSEGTLWREWSKANVCVLDEVGCTDRASGHHFAVLLKALDLRNDPCKPLVVVSNLSPEQIATTYDDRIGSRMCSGMVVQTKGDRRVGGG